LRLIEATGVRENMRITFNQVLSQVPQEDRAKYEVLLQVEDLLKRIVPIYAKYYTEDELVQILSFYRSPAGTKYLQATPQIVNDSVKEALKYFNEKSGK
jgi:uncharacterized protein